MVFASGIKTLEESTTVVVNYTQTYFKFINQNMFLATSTEILMISCLLFFNMNIAGLTYLVIWKYDSSKIEVILTMIYNSNTSFLIGLA